MHTSQCDPSRRQLLMFATSLLAGTSIPRTARAVGPATYIEAAEAVVNIISGIAGLFGNTDLRDAMKQILATIEGVLAQQQRIIADLASLRLHIDEALFTSWQAAYARSIVSYNQQLANYTADLNSSNWRIGDRLREDLEALSRDAGTATLSIGQMDPWAFQSFGIGVSIVLTADKILGTSTQRTTETKKGFRNCIDRWLDSGNPKSIVSEQSQMSTLIGKLTSDLSSRSRTYVTRNQRVDDGEYWWIERDILTVNGSIEGGFTGQQRTEQGNRNRHNCNHGGCKVDRPLTSENKLSAAAPKADGPQTTIVVPGFNPSGWDIVDGFNKARIQIFDAMAARERQQILQATMAQAKTALA